MTPSEWSEQDSYNLRRIADATEGIASLAQQRDFRQQAEAHAATLRESERREVALRAERRRAAVAKNFLYAIGTALVVVGISLLARWLT